jgi:hypothetical protein
LNHNFEIAIDFLDILKIYSVLKIIYVNDINVKIIKNDANNIS